MDNFFETYLEWIIDKYNDGDNINDILTSGYTANTGTYYCPECTYVLTRVETYLKFTEVVGFNTPGFDLGCCVNIMGSIETYLKWAEALQFTQSQAVPAIGYSEQTNREFPFCCNTTKFCVESNVSPENMELFLDKAIVEQGSSSEIYDTNSCYLFDRLNQEDYSESQVFEIFSSILDYGIVIWCCNGIISAIAVEEYLNLADNCEACFARWLTPTYEGQSQTDACNTTLVTGPDLFSGNINLNIGDIIYYVGTLSTPFNGNDNWFKLTSACPESELVFVAQINNNGEIIDIGCP